MDLRTNSVGEFVQRAPVTGACQVQSATAGVRRDPTIMRAGRVRDTRLAEEVARALFRGNPVKIGLNERGVVGIGNAWEYRPIADGHGVQKMWADGEIIRVFHNYRALMDDVLSALRRPTFRVLAFGDALASRGYSQIHPQSIAYTVPVSERLTHIPVGQLTCQLGTVQRGPLRAHSLAR